MLPRAVLVLSLSVGCLFSAAPRAEEPAQETRPRDLFVIRVFTLKGIDLRDAMMAVRGANDIRKVVIVRERDAMVVSDTADRVAEAEALLKEKGVLFGATEPSGPLYLEELARSPGEIRVFRVDGDLQKIAQSVLRTMYDARDVKWSEVDRTLQLTAAPAILSSAEALLKELHLLSEAAKL